METERPDRQRSPHAPPRLGPTFLVVLVAALVLVVAPSLPFLALDTLAGGRLHNFAIFAGGVAIGWLFATARSTLPSGTGRR
jgi:hypothetical protein